MDSFKASATLIVTKDPTPTFVTVLMSVPSQDLNRSWPAEKTNMLSRTSKRVKNLVDIIGLFKVIKNHSCQAGEKNKIKFISTKIKNMLRHMPRLNSIVEISLPNCFLNLNEEISQILKKSPEIKVLNLYNSYFINDIENFANAIGSLTKLISLNLKCVISDSKNTKKLINELSNCTKLEHLNINDCYIDIIGINLFSEALPNWLSLTSLNLGGNRMKNEGLNSFVKASTFLIALVSLDLSFNFINGIEGAKILRPLLENSSTITRLNISHNSFGIKGSIYLAAVLANQGMLSKTNLKELYFNNNQIGIDGAKSILIMLNYLKLTHIDLTNNLINQNEVQWLIKGLSKFPTVTYLIKQ